ncbi:uncharacterized protein TRAVEDRAFT_46054 [Trametes versicolor FP-101664 SS1]|uniref:uncharacterized protein n=1 Tax=Trametes versicolor (strain FP-101664) TaxID=717944 RepID=UPI0004621C9E|nr:uncharacterized protein TRAVEDRAFT_46054 [Trametes versicolor FP-101664 SS1]EIW60813.1 hypothetical protein TRAVEDRAFT_46054 [Trametes versicolor FP-101664 SS1]
MVCRAEWVSPPPQRTVHSDATAGPQAVVDDLSLGIPSESVAALDTALLAWLQTHHYGLMVLATATVYLNGGHALHFSPDTPRAISISVQPMPKDLTALLSGSSDDNPGKGFHILSTLSFPSTELLEAYGPGFNWDEAQSACQVVEGKMRDLAGDNFVGDTGFCVRASPAIFHIKNSPVLRGRPIMVMSELPGRSGSTTLDAETRAMLEDVRTLCISLMSTGLVMRMNDSEREDDFAPEVGTLVRRKKKQWEWEPIPNWDWGRAAALVPRDRMKTELTLEELWESFYFG